MYNSCNCGPYYSDAEEMSTEDQEAFLKEKKTILQAKLETVKFLLQSLKKKASSDKKE